MLTAVKPRGPASESLRRCSVLPELIEEGIVATAEVILTGAESSSSRGYEVKVRPEGVFTQAPTFRRYGDNEGRGALSRCRILARCTSQERASRNLIEARVDCSQRQRL